MEVHLLIEARSHMHSNNNVDAFTCIARDFDLFNRPQEDSFLIVICRVNHFERFPRHFGVGFTVKCGYCFAQCDSTVLGRSYKYHHTLGPDTLPSIVKKQQRLILTTSLLFWQHPIDVNNNPGDAEHHGRTCLHSSFHHSRMSISGKAACSSDRLERHQHFHDKACLFLQAFSLNDKPYAGLVVAVELYVAEVFYKQGLANIV